MKPGGESQGSLEATRRITPLLTKVTSIGTWNVRTMFETGKTCQVAAEHTWNQLEKRAEDRGAWRTLVGGLCPSGGNRHK